MIEFYQSEVWNMDVYAQKENFKDWLKTTRNVSDSTLLAYTDTIIERVSEIINSSNDSKVKALNHNIYVYQTIDAFEKFFKIIKADPNFDIVNRTGQAQSGWVSTPLNHYKKFLLNHLQPNEKSLLENLIIEYKNFKKSDKWDEQYKYQHFEKLANLFDNLDNIPEKLRKIGSPNFGPYFWKSSAFKYLGDNFLDEFRDILANLFDEQYDLEIRIKTFRSKIKTILLNAPDWNNKDMVDPSVESASFFLALKDYKKYLLFTRIKPYTKFSKLLKLGFENLSEEQRYITWIKYCDNTLIPELNKYGNDVNTLLDCQDFTWYVSNKDSEDEIMTKENVLPLEMEHNIPLNQILYGPPGTGKTYNTVLKAMSIIDNTEYKDVSEEQYTALKTRFDELKQAGQIEFVTFHQSYSYEEFVEGIKPYIPEWGSTDNADVKYIGENGIFKRICKKAESPIIKNSDNSMELNDNPKIWKVSLMKTGENEIRKDCMENSRIRIGFDKYGETINDETVFDDGGSRVLSAFIDKMEIGDIVLSCYSEKTIDAIGVVTSEYKWNNDFPQYKRYREVKWLAKGLNHNILEINNGTKFTLGTVYQLNNISLKDVLDIVDEQEKVTSYKENDKPYILIIDEINRGDASKRIDYLN